ncbi:ethylbenzene dehydrogenase-related protein [Haloarcula amylovorans]|uniref:ethylbenzene dehydrogenase-related protein n=1 Tax=Haloarcula amylovorans TaxID=2562280 RepID=UPI0010769308|nr:ethylbenzene dehydrogenase-related protein [Halomicroarcula amylolytica]
MRGKELRLAALLAVGLLAATVVAPMTVDARPAFEIPVHYATDGDSLDRVDGEEWGQAPPVTVPMSSAGAAVPSADNTTVEQIRVSAARTDERLYLHLAWADPTNDTSTERVRAFADAVAVQLPSDADERPPIAMGGTDNPVNVWYWSGSGQTQELLAGGPGSTTQFRNGTVATNYTHSDGRWEVVFSRPLSPPGENRTTVPSDQDMDVAFAAWNGSNMERSGQKSTSQWYYLALGPGPEGPPYEAILWAIAGIGIVVTTLVTIQGVRRTGGG